MRRPEFALEVIACSVADAIEAEKGALHRLEKRGLVNAKWETAPDRNREFKYYRLTDKGRKQLAVEESQWKQMVEAVALVMAHPRGELK
jgi:DNA-binding PadR family transcriptional regulator